MPRNRGNSEVIVLGKYFGRSRLTRYTLANASDFLDPLGPYSLTLTPTYHFRRLSGASDGNRTRMTSLEGWGSTIELHSQSGFSSPFNESRQNSVTY